jgi:B9 domain-containing protein 1
MPGKHEKYIRMFAPVSSSWLTRLIAWVTGTFAEYIEAPKTLAEAEGREVTRVRAEGVVKIVFQVSIRNLDKYGYYN